MILAIKKLDDSVYIDKTFVERFGEDKLKDYGYIKVVIDDKYLDCESFDFNDDLTFNIEKYDFRHQSEDDEKKLYTLQTNLEKTDYIANKLAEANAEYIVTEDKTKLIELRNKYSKELADRETWRKEIDSLKEKLKKL